ncbi:MAG: N-acetylmuramoyl-L-alanine amidase-like domain-containing protein [Bacteroidota bacterium]
MTGPGIPRRIFLRILLAAGGGLLAGRAGGRPAFSFLQTRTDEEIALAMMGRAGARGEGDFASLVVSLALAFRGTPYGAGTLETAGEERLVVNLRALDCVTFVESTLALGLCVRQGDGTFEGFRRRLEHIRYRGGVRAGYASRLHYFTDWIADNQRKGILRDVTRILGGEPENRPVGFMTAHRNAYPPLAEEPVLEQMRRVEAALTASTRWRIRKARVGRIADKMRNGDIVALTTDREGLDVSHTGWAVREGGEIRLLHASPVCGSVCMTEESLAAHVARSRQCTGIVVARVAEHGAGGRAPSQP